MHCCVKVRLSLPIQITCLCTQSFSCTSCLPTFFSGNMCTWGMWSSFCSICEPSRYRTGRATAESVSRTRAEPAIECPSCPAERKDQEDGAAGATMMQRDCNERVCMCGVCADGSGSSTLAPSSPIRGHVFFVHADSLPLPLHLLILPRHPLIQVSSDFV